MITDHSLLTLQGKVRLYLPDIHIMLLDHLIKARTIVRYARLADWANLALWAGLTDLGVFLIDAVLFGNESTEDEEDDDPESEVDGSVHSVY